MRPYINRNLYNFDRLQQNKHFHNILNNARPAINTNINNNRNSGKDFFKCSSKINRTFNNYIISFINFSQK